MNILQLLPLHMYYIHVLIYIDCIPCWAPGALAGRSGSTAWRSRSLRTSSRWAVSSNKFFDYISSGLPVLNNYPGWLADMITQNHCGVVVPPEDAKAFAEALVRLADHPELRKEFGKNGRLLAEKEFDRNKLADAFVDFLEDIYAQYNS